MKILVTGCLGYTGSVLVENLLKKGHIVFGLDNFWFGNKLSSKIIKNNKFKLIKKDIRDDKFELPSIEAIIHLAAVANDPSTDLNPNLTWEIGCIGTKNIIEKAIKKKVKKFIYASSGSVYGIKKEKKVNEKLPLKPISIYNKTKMTTERLLLSYKEDINIIMVRPATVCGYSPRIRYDVSVNALTINALEKNLITVFGGKQVRPNIHIDDLCCLYEFLLHKKIKSGEIFNAGFENISIINIAKKIKSKINVPIKILPSNDPRSYRVDSSKLLRIGFKPKKKVEDAINELIYLYKQNKIPQMNDSTFNVKWMKKKNFQ